MALDLIAPEVPDAQKNAGPSLFMQSLGQGLQAAARFSQMKRDSEMELLKLAEHERLSQEQHEIEREKMAADADYRAKALEVTSELNQAHINLFDSQADAWKNGTARAWQNTAAFNQQKEQLVNEVNDSATELKLNDPKFATDQPVQYAANVLKFRDMYGLSPMPEVKNAITQFQMTADQQKIPLKMAEGARPQQVPIWKVVEKLNDPEQKDQMMEVLKANGHFSEETSGGKTKSWSRPIDSMWDALFGPSVPLKTTDKPTPTMKRILDKGEGVTFERESSRVPPAMLRRSDARGTSGPTAMPDTAPLPDPDLPPIDGEPQASAKPPLQFEPSETDKIIMQAKAAIAKGAPKDRVLRRLQEMGIGPEALA